MTSLKFAFARRWKVFTINRLQIYTISFLSTLFLLFIAKYRYHSSTLIQLRSFVWPCEETSIYIISISSEIVACMETQNNHIIVLQFSG